MSRTTRCRACDGRGYPLEMGEETCSHCLGTGRDTRSDLWAEPCRHCPNSCGRVTYCRRSLRPCHHCNGRGLVNY